MSQALMSAVISGRLGCIWVIAFTRAVGTLFNLLTTFSMSKTLGCVVVVDGGLNSNPTSPERRVYIGTGAATAAQSPSEPSHDAPHTCTVYSDLGRISAPYTAINPSGFQSQ